VSGIGNRAVSAVRASSSLGAELGRQAAVGPQSGNRSRQARARGEWWRFERGEVIDGQQAHQYRRRRRARRGPNQGGSCCASHLADRCPATRQGVMRTRLDRSIRKAERPRCFGPRSASGKKQSSSTSRCYADSFAARRPGTDAGRRHALVAYRRPARAESRWVDDFRGDGGTPLATRRGRGLKGEEGGAQLLIPSTPSPFFKLPASHRPLQPPPPPPRYVARSQRSQVYGACPYRPRSTPARLPPYPYHTVGVVSPLYRFQPRLVNFSPSQPATPHAIPINDPRLPHVAVRAPSPPDLFPARTKTDHVNTEESPSSATVPGTLPPPLPTPPPPTPPPQTAEHALHYRHHRGKPLHSPPPPWPPPITFTTHLHQLPPSASS